MTWPEARPPQRTVSLVLKELSAVMTCGQCGQGVVYQGDDAAPSCAECGWQSPTTWRDALIDIFELPKALRARDGNSMLKTKVIKAGNRGLSVKPDKSLVSRFFGQPELTSRRQVAV